MTKYGKVFEIFENIIKRNMIKYLANDKIQYQPKFL